MKFQLVVLFVTLHLNFVHGGRILAVIGTNLNSHFQVFKSVVEHLSPYHDITFYMDPKFNYKHSNVTVRHVNARNIEISTSRIFENACNMDMYGVFYENILTINETSIDEVWSKSVSLINTNETYDLLLVSGYGTDHFFQLAHRFNIPIVQVTPSVLFNWHNEAMHNPYSWINDFSFMINENTDTFTGRLKKYIKNALINYRFFWGHMQAINRVTKKYFPPGTPLVEEVLKKTDLILVNTHNVMGYARPNVPLVVEIGGLHIKPYKPLPNDLEEFISGSGEHGFIYFSLGTLVQESTVSENVVQAFLNVFRKLPQRVLWKWNGKMRNVPSNVKISKWFPQSDILGHSKIKLFIQQGGMLSMQEAIYNGVPVLIMPVLFDQHSNAYLAEQKGYGRSLTFCDFTQELFEKHVAALVHNTSYSENVKRISRVMKDQNKLVSERVNWWINFVIRHKGTSVLRPTIKYESWTDIPYDIFSFFMFIASCTLYLSLYFVLYVFRYLIGHNTDKFKKE